MKHPTSHFVFQQLQYACVEQATCLSIESGSYLSKLNMIYLFDTWSGWKQEHISSEESYCSIKSTFGHNLIESKRLADKLRASALSGHHHG
jgi:hypothetical protein